MAFLGGPSQKCDATIRTPAGKVSKRKRLGAELIEASFKGLHREVERLINEGADIETRDYSGYTAVSESAIAGHCSVTGQLLRALADPNSVAHDGRTALHRATFHGWLNVVKILLDNGADPTIQDTTGKLPIDLARRQNVREAFDACRPEKTREALEERRRKLARLPKPPVDEPEEEAADGAEEVAKAAAAAEAEKLKEEEAKKAAASARRKKVPLTKAAREKRYREALAELQLGEDSNAEGTVSSYRPIHMARLEVMGAGEERLNGVYTASFLTKDHVEFEKDSDPQCQIFWCDYHKEWRMLIGDFKLGSVLYRHSYKPNLKADECHGAPEMNWQKWFGKGPEPLILHLPPSSSADETPSADTAVATTAESTTTAGKENSPQSPKSTAGDVAPVTAVESPKPKTDVQRRSEFLELHPRLKIVATDETGLARRDITTAKQTSSKQINVGLSGERIVETSEGLFAPGEAEEEDLEVSLQSQGGAESHARNWLRDDVGGASEIPPVWSAVKMAKDISAELFKEGKPADARRATTAAIQALGKLEKLVGLKQVGARLDEMDGDEGADGDDSDDPLEPTGAGLVEPKDTDSTRDDYKPSKDELEMLNGVLHSNRSLLIMQQIQAKDADVLQFGQDAAWRLVVDDADVALNADAKNFKASFRRANALFELGDLKEALTDATSVVDHYSRTSMTPNPEAAALRDNILEAVRKDRNKWQGPAQARWNRGGNTSAFVKEMRGEKNDGEDASTSQSLTSVEFWSAKSSKPSAAVAGVRSIGTAGMGARAPQAPKTGAEVEKALLNQLKGDAAKQAAYVREHLPGQALRKFFRRAPCGPDLLAALVGALAELAQEDASGAEERLTALATTPSAKIHAAMFDAKERVAFDQLLARVGPEAGAVWASPETKADDAIV